MVRTVVCEVGGPSGPAREGIVPRGPRDLGWQPIKPRIRVFVRFDAGAGGPNAGEKARIRGVEGGQNAANACPSDTFQGIRTKV